MYLYNYYSWHTYTHYVCIQNTYIYIYHIIKYKICILYIIWNTHEQIYQNIRSSRLHLLYFSFDGQFFKNRQAQPIWWPSCSKQASTWRYQRRSNWTHPQSTYQWCKDFQVFPDPHWWSHQSTTKARVHHSNPNFPSKWEWNSSRNLLKVV